MEWWNNGNGASKTQYSSTPLLQHFSWFVARLLQPWVEMVYKSVNRR